MIGRNKREAADLREPDHWAGDLFGEAHLAASAPRPPSIPGRKLLPGITISSVAAAAAAWFSDHYGMPIILMGLLLGLALQFVSLDPRTEAGLEFISRRCLRWGIVLLGFQVTLAQIGGLGFVPFAALIVVMAAAGLAAFVGARMAGQGPAVGMLAGGATAICGASAALALYGVIGRERVSQAQFTLTLVVISVASALAMTIYPELAQLAHMNARQAGFLTGAAIHDVAQSIGGGYAVSNAAGAA
ncbi:MAG TPA: putative sulfate exporter family transporter, partial [Novosphingobium sp.]|nr:putative sulfate exporter family transporter [Novosphingobium sp.]